MDKLFTELHTAYDPKNRPTYICKDADGKFFVYKPRTGFKSRGFDIDNDERLLAIFERQSHDGHNAASYLPGEAPGSEVADLAPVITPQAPVTTPAPPAVEQAPVITPQPPADDQVPNNNQD